MDGTSKDTPRTDVTGRSPVTANDEWRRLRSAIWRTRPSSPSWRPSRVCPTPDGEQKPDVPVAVMGRARFLSAPVVCRLLGGELQELLGGGGVALVGEAAQFVHVAKLGGEFDQLVGRGGVAAVGKVPQFMGAGNLPSLPLSRRPGWRW